MRNRRGRGPARVRSSRLVTLVLACAALMTAALGLPATATAADTTPARRGMLVLYDSTGPWAFLGDMYAQVEGNLASHFGSWTAEAVTDYKPGDMARYSAVTYSGSTFGEPLPAAFLDDVLAGGTPVLWAGVNIWELETRAADVRGDGAFAAQYGWTYGGLDKSAIDGVVYKGRTLTRVPGNAAGIVGIDVTDPAKVTVLAQAEHTDGTTTP